MNKKYNIASAAVIHGYVLSALLLPHLSYKAYRYKQLGEYKYVDVVLLISKKSHS